MTRAKKLLYIIGDLKFCQFKALDTPLGKLAMYAEQIRKQHEHPLNAPERAMQGILEEMGLSYVQQYELGRYRLDFLVNSPSGKRYDLEIDGDIHHTAEAIQHDETRDVYTKNKGLEVLRFAARDVMNQPSLIKERLSRI